MRESIVDGLLVRWRVRTEATPLTVFRFVVLLSVAVRTFSAPVGIGIVESKNVTSDTALKQVQP